MRIGNSRFRHNTPIECLTFTGDGQYLVAGSRFGLRAFKRNGEIILDDTIHALDIDAWQSGTLVAVVGHGLIGKLDVAKGNLEGFEPAVDIMPVSVAFLGAIDTVVVGSADGTVAVFNLERETRLHLFEHVAGRPAHVSRGEDDTFTVRGGGYSTVYDSRTFEKRWTNQYEAQPGIEAISPSRDAVARANGAKIEMPSNSDPMSGRTRALAFSANGENIATADDDAILVWQQDKLVGRVESGAKAICFVGDKVAWAIDSSVGVHGGWHVPHGNHQVISIEPDPTSQMLLVTFTDGIAVYRASDGHKLLDGHMVFNQCPACWRNQDEVVTYNGGELKVWDLASGDVSLHYFVPNAEKIAVSHDGELLYTCEGGELRVRSLHDGETLRWLDVMYSTQMSWGPQRKLLVRQNAQRAQIIDAEVMAEVASFQFYRYWLHGVALDPANRRVALALSDGTVRIEPLDKEQPLPLHAASSATDGELRRDVKVRLMRAAELLEQSESTSSHGPYRSATTPTGLTTQLDQRGLIVIGLGRSTLVAMTPAGDGFELRVQIANDTSKLRPRGFARLAAWFDKNEATTEDKAWADTWWSKLDASAVTVVRSDDRLSVKLQLMQLPSAAEIMQLAAECLER